MDFSQAKRASKLRSEISHKYQADGNFDRLFDELFDGTELRMAIVGMIYFDITNQDGTKDRLDELVREGKETLETGEVNVTQGVLDAKADALRIWAYVREYIRREDPKVLALIRTGSEEE